MTSRTDIDAAITGPASFPRRTMLLAVALVPLYEFLLLSRGGSWLFEPAQYGTVFNAMALNLLQGRMDIEPSLIGIEAFIHDGRTYAYFGIFPALLRFPLIPFVDIADLPLGRLSIWVALSLGALAQVATALSAFRAVPEGPARTAVQTRLLLAACLSGPPILLGLSGTIFDEANAWAWSLAASFCALAVHGMVRPAGFSAGLLGLMALLAGCCALSRPPTGFGLSVSLGLIVLTVIVRSGNLRGALASLFAPRVLVPTVIIFGFAAIAAAVNQARWGDPFVIGDVRLQTLMVEQYPERLERFERYGYFNVVRLGYGLLYYFLPIWLLRAADGTMLFEARIGDLFDAFELPPATFLLTDPLTLLLSAIGVVALLRGRLAGIARAPALGLVAGLCIAPTMMLMAWFMAFRYRLDFAPLFFTLACLGAASWAVRANAWPAERVRRWDILFAVLLVVQFLSSHLAAALYSLSHLGPAHDHLSGGLIDYYRDQLLTRMGGGGGP